MFRERELNENSVHGGIVVKVFDGGKKLIDRSTPRTNKWTESYLHLGDGLWEDLVSELNISLTRVSEHDLQGAGGRKVSLPLEQPCLSCEHMC